MSERFNQPIESAQEVQAAQARAEQLAQASNGMYQDIENGHRFVARDEVSRVQDLAGKAELDDENSITFAQMMSDLQKGELPEGVKRDFKLGRNEQVKQLREKVEGRLELDNETRKQKRDESQARQQELRKERAELVKDKEQQMHSELLDLRKETEAKALETEMSSVDAKVEAAGGDAINKHYARREAEAEARKLAQKAGREAAAEREAVINENGGAIGLNKFKEREAAEAVKKDFQERVLGKVVTEETATTEEKELPEWAQVERPDAVPYKDWINMSKAERKQAVESAQATKAATATTTVVGANTDTDETTMPAWTTIGTQTTEGQTVSVEEKSDMIIGLEDEIRDYFDDLMNIYIDGYSSNAPLDYEQIYDLYDDIRSRFDELGALHGWSADEIQQRFQERIDMMNDYIEDSGLKDWVASGNSFEDFEYTSPFSNIDAEGNVDIDASTNSQEQETASKWSRFKRGIRKGLVKGGILAVGAAAVLTGGGRKFNGWVDSKLAESSMSPRKQRALKVVGGVAILATAAYGAYKLGFENDNDGTSHTDMAAEAMVEVEADGDGVNIEIPTVETFQVEPGHGLTQEISDSFPGHEPSQYLAAHQAALAQFGEGYLQGVETYTQNGEVFIRNAGTGNWAPGVEDFLRQHLESQA